MSYNDKSWNNAGNYEFRGPSNISGRPAHGVGSGNMHLQNQRYPHIGPQLRQPVQNFSNVPEPPFIHGSNRLSMPRNPNFQNLRPPPRSQPPLSQPTLPQPPLSHPQLPHPQLPQPHPQMMQPPQTNFSNPPFQNFSIPPPNLNTLAHRHPPPSPLIARGIGCNVPGFNMNSRPPPLPVPSAFQHMPSHPPLPQMPHRFQNDHLQHSGTSYTPVIKFEGLGNINLDSSRQNLDEKEIGAQKLEKWLQKSGKTKRSQFKDLPHKKQPKQICKSVDQLSAMTKLISFMSDKLKEASDCISSASNSTWETITTSLEELKNNYTSLEPLLEESSIQNIEKKLLKIRRKRARLRGARVRRFEEQQRLKEVWAMKSQEIDKWQERHRAKIKEENLRKSRKAAADLTLSKVTREIHDANRLIDTMLALQKLRLIRRDAAQKRGDTDLGESRQTFEQKIADMTRLVQSQLECYKEEEAKLKQVIKSEQEEVTEKERQAQLEQEKLKQEEEDEVLQVMLFGSQENISTMDPRFPYVQYYRQAESNLQSFIQIRHEWDSFLVPENTPASSAIPSSWVHPEPPSSTTWATALE